MASQDEVQRLRNQAKKDRDLIARAAQVLAEIDRSTGLSDEHADVLAALRIRIEGRERARLEDLLGATGDISGKKRLDDLIGEPEGGSDWPVVEEKKRDWPGT